MDRTQKTFEFSEENRYRKYVTFGELGVWITIFFDEKNSVDFTLTWEEFNQLRMSETIYQTEKPTEKPEKPKE